MRLLGHQGPQYGNQLGRRDVVQAQHLGDVFVVDARARGRIGDGHGRGARVLVADNAQHATGAHGGVTVHIENGEKQIVQLAGIDRFGGDHFDFALDVGIDHDRGLGRFGHKADQLLDIGVFQVEREVLGQRRAGHREQHSQSEHRAPPLPRAAQGSTRGASRRGCTRCGQAARRQARSRKSCRRKPCHRKPRCKKPCRGTPYRAARREQPCAQPARHRAAPGPRSLMSISRVTVPPSRSRVNVARVASRIS